MDSFIFCYYIINVSRDTYQSKHRRKLVDAYSCYTQFEHTSLDHIQRYYILTYRHGFRKFRGLANICWLQTEMLGWPWRLWGFKGRLSGGVHILDSWILIRNSMLSWADDYHNQHYRISQFSAELQAWIFQSACYTLRLAICIYYCNNTMDCAYRCDQRIDLCPRARVHSRLYSCSA